jgi:hypothetical protein
MYRPVGYGMFGVANSRGISPENVRHVKSVRTAARIIPYPTGRLFGLALSQALRAWLQSHRPSGTFSDVPFKTILDRVADGTYRAKPAKIFRFEEIQDAHRLMDANQANGKIVVAH